MARPGETTTLVVEVAARERGTSPFASPPSITAKVTLEGVIETDQELRELVQDTLDGAAAQLLTKDGSRLPIPTGMKRARDALAEVLDGVRQGITECNDPSTVDRHNPCGAALPDLHHAEQVLCDVLGAPSAYPAGNAIARAARTTCPDEEEVVDAEVTSAHRPAHGGRPDCRTRLDESVLWDLPDMRDSTGAGLDLPDGQWTDIGWRDDEDGHLILAPAPGAVRAERLAPVGTMRRVFTDRAWQAMMVGGHVAGVSRVGG